MHRYDVTKAAEAPEPLRLAYGPLCGAATTHRGPGEGEKWEGVEWPAADPDLRPTAVKPAAQKGARVPIQGDSRTQRRHGNQL
jgi:hypothetical protein